MPHAESGFAQICGAPIYYQTAGTGRPLVLLHEGFADSRMFDQQEADFAERHRVIRYDRHGSGQSGLPAVPYTDHDALRDLLRHLGIARAAVLGMSAGGAVALDFALAHPEMVDALLLVASAISGAALSEETLRGWGEIGGALERGDVPGAVDLTLRMWVDGPKRAPEDVDPAVRARMREMMAHFYARPRPAPEPLLPPAIGRLAEVRVPTLVVAADGDVHDILAYADILERGIAGARKEIIAGPAHVPNMERPEAFNRLVLDFLAGQESRPGSR